MFTARFVVVLLLWYSQGWNGFDCGTGGLDISAGATLKLFVNSNSASLSGPLTGYGTLITSSVSTLNVMQVNSSLALVIQYAMMIIGNGEGYISARSLELTTPGAALSAGASRGQINITGSVTVSGVGPFSYLSAGE